MNPFRDNELALMRRERDEAKAALEAQAAKLQAFEQGREMMDEERRAAIASARDLREQLADAEGRLKARTRDRFRERLGVLTVWLGGIAMAAGALAFMFLIVTKLRECDDAENLEAGFVVAREYHPPYTSEDCTTTTKTTTCTPVHHPERFTLTMADGQHEERVIEVEEEEWLRRSPGERFCLDGVHCPPVVDDARDR